MSARTIPINPLASYLTLPSAHRLLPLLRPSLPWPAPPRILLRPHLRPERYAPAFCPATRIRFGQVFPPFPPSPIPIPNPVFSHIKPSPVYIARSLTLILPSSLSTLTSSAALFTGKGLYVLSTSALLVMVPWAMAYVEEQAIVEQERELKQREVMGEGVSPGAALGKAAL